MFSVQTNNITFYGKTRYLSCNSEGKAKTISDCPFGTASFGDTRGLSDFVRKHSFPSAKIEETIGTIHENRTHKIYVADPYETVNDLIRLNHDYVVYDLEPGFPDIKLFFKNEHNDISKGFKIVNDYYKRLEAMGITSDDKDIISFSKMKQRLVDTCAQIFGESAELREKRISLENKIKNKLILINETETSLPKYTTELNTKMKGLENNKKTLIRIEETHRRLKEKQLSLKNKSNITPEEIKKANDAVEKYELILQKLKYKIDKNIKKIEILDNFVSTAPSRIAYWKQEITNLQKEINGITEALIPNFKKLKNFYTVNGIKIIKRV